MATKRKAKKAAPKKKIAKKAAAKRPAKRAKRISRSDGSKHVGVRVGTRVVRKPVSFEPPPMEEAASAPPDETGTFATGEYEKVEALKPEESAGHFTTPSGLTEAEHQRLRDCQTTAEYEEVALAVKTAHGGYYPPDWFAMVLADGGYLSAIRAREGKTDEPVMTVSHQNPDGTAQVVATVPGPKPAEDHVVPPEASETA